MHAALSNVRGASAQVTGLRSPAPVWVKVKLPVGINAAPETVESSTVALHVTWVPAVVIDGTQEIKVVVPLVVAVRALVTCPWLWMWSPSPP